MWPWSLAGWPQAGCCLAPDWCFSLRSSIGSSAWWVLPRADCPWRLSRCECRSAFTPPFRHAVYPCGLGQCCLTPCLDGLLLPFLILGGNCTEPWEVQVKDLKFKLHEFCSKSAFAAKLKIYLQARSYRGEWCQIYCFSISSWNWTKKKKFVEACGKRGLISSFVFFLDSLNIRGFH